MNKKWIIFDKNNLGDIWRVESLYEFYEEFCIKEDNLLNCIKELADNDIINAIKLHEFEVGGIK